MHCWLVGLRSQLTGKQNTARVAPEAKTWMWAEFLDGGVGVLLTSIEDIFRLWKKHTEGLLKSTNTPC